MWGQARGAHHASGVDRVGIPQVHILLLRIKEIVDILNRLQQLAVCVHSEERPIGAPVMRCM